MFDLDRRRCIKTYCWFIYGQVLGLLRFGTCQGGFSEGNFPTENFSLQGKVVTNVISNKSQQIQTI